MREGLESDHVKRHKEEMRKVRECIEAYHKQRMREAVKQARDEILNNSSTGGSNDAVPDLSITISVSK